MAIQYFQPRLPIEIDDNNKFIMISESLKNVKQRLSMIILTNPGEKIMDPVFGVGISRYLFEPNSGILTFNNDSYTLNNFRNTIKQSILYQVDTYASDITINDVLLSSDDITLNLTINYNYRSFIDDTLTISLGS